LGYLLLIVAAVWMLWTPPLARQGRITLAWISVASCLQLTIALKKWLLFAAAR
jgi:hypothetical protein